MWVWVINGLGWDITCDGKLFVTYIKGRWVLMMKSGLEFLYTRREDVCSHCQVPSFVWRR